MAAASVEFRGVTKRYGMVVAVNDVSFLVERGTLVTLLGPSGCGKTTMLRLIAGLELANSGQILIGERDVTRLSAAERDVSMVFQSYALFPHLTVLENAAYGPLVSGVRRRDAQAMAALFIDQAQVTGFDGSMLSGRAEIETQLATVFRDHPTASYVGKVRSVLPLGGDVAVLWAVAGMMPPGQTDINPALNAVQSLVAVRQDGHWRAASYQNTPAAFHGRPAEVDRLSGELRQEIHR